MASTFDSAIYDRTQTENNKWRQHPADVLPMFVADMDFRSPQPIIDALTKRVQHGFFGYGKEEPEWYDVVTSRIERRYGWKVEPDWIMMFPGVINSFNLALKALTPAGSGVLVQTPGYGPILSSPANQKMERQEAPLGRDANGRYFVDWELFDGAITETTKSFVLCNPHNPVGRVFDRDEVQGMADRCLKNDLLIISDEIHCDLLHAPAAHIPIASIDPEVARRTITLMAPSKTFNLPGLKTSIAIVPDAEMREKMTAAKEGLVGTPNILGYHAALAAYRDCDPWLEEASAYLTANRDFMAEFVAREMPGVRMYPAEGTYLAWLDCNGLDLQPDPQAFFLEKAKVGLSNGANFGTGGEGFVRLNFACPRPMLEDGLQRMAKALANR